MHGWMDWIHRVVTMHPPWMLVMCALSLVELIQPLSWPQIYGTKLVVGIEYG